MYNTRDLAAAAWTSIAQSFYGVVQCAKIAIKHHVAKTTCCWVGQRYKSYSCAYARIKTKGVLCKKKGPLGFGAIQ